MISTGLGLVIWLAYYNNLVTVEIFDCTYDVCTVGRRDLAKNLTVRGHSKMTSAERGREGVAQNLMQ